MRFCLLLSSFNFLGLLEVAGEATCSLRCVSGDLKDKKDRTLTGTPAGDHFISRQRTQVGHVQGLGWLAAR